MTPERLRTACLAFTGAGEEFPFDEHLSVFKVGGKMFALSALGRRPLSVNLKCDPELALQLRASYPAVTPGWHMNKRHWNTVVLDDGSLPEQLILDLVEDSYDLVVAKLPRETRERLGWKALAEENVRRGPSGPGGRS
ncbi:putative DNA-binding protein (MmcQ/YjbR family) [Prauserella isguenensis]|uniref:Putative DNA-binding protein (MmcQ/YjbR family) n=1 Tax=Prauserella isguenensis TaxID=1470180 RepID=A0A839S134_9PSEU|nr:MmcQ/YjbR family DNA-binding protein [Prauserella isguenensis]MBB3051004.1 putative DNA-binding protein (MmcQ/YjbR family) [Prauserella isguenensis]